MELNDRDIDWQKEAPNLAAAGRRIPYTVPAGYFESLNETLNQRVSLERFIETVPASNVPENYFDDLSERIHNRISLESIRTAVPTDGLTVPDNYFSELEVKINARIKQPEEEVKPIRRLFRSWATYAAAACITMLIGTVVYLNSASYEFSQQLSKIPDQEIVNYLEVYSTAGDTEFIIENLSPEELDQVSGDVSADELEQYINNSTL